MTLLMNRINWRAGKRPGELFANLTAVGGPTIKKADGSCVALKSGRRFADEAALVAALDEGRATAAAEKGVADAARVAETLRFAQGMRTALQREMTCGNFQVSWGDLQVRQNAHNTWVTLEGLEVEGHRVTNPGFDRYEKYRGLDFATGVEVGGKVLAAFLEGCEMDVENLGSETVTTGTYTSVRTTRRRVTLLSGERVERESRDWSDSSPHTKYDDCPGNGAW